MFELAEKIRKFSRDRKGFTLVELLVVVVIIAILAAVLIPKLLDYTNEARVSRAMGDLASMRAVIEAYAADEGKGAYPKSNSVYENDSHYIASVLRARGIKWGGQDGIRDPWGTPYEYAVATGYPDGTTYYDYHYRLFSFGPDKQPLTPDDIYCTDNQMPVQGVPPGVPGSGNSPVWDEPSKSAS